jgi:hypothetical protein
VVADRWFASSKSHWYGGVTEADVPTLVEQHLVGGEPVETLHIGPDDFCGWNQRAIWPEGSISNTVGAYSR